jgi:hypothetical protein
MIIELEQGLGGLVHVSPQPMRRAVTALGGSPIQGMRTSEAEVEAALTEITYQEFT